jgi:phytoene synthase
MERLQARLTDLYAGQPQDHAADRALSIVVREFGIPRALPQALLEGFDWDAQGRSYETLSDVLDYSARVAGAVGTMMAIILGAREPWALARASELGLAMQLTNIARDVGEDARRGRLYLPRQWMREAGLDPDAWLRQPVPGMALASVVQRLLDEADRLYERAVLGVAALPRDCRPAIQAAARIYAEIGRELERCGLDSVNRRAVVSARRKRWLMLLSMTAALPHLPDADLLQQARVPPQREIAHLVAACPSAGSAGWLPDGVPDRSVGERVVWMIDLCERVSHRHRLPMS